MTTMKKILNKCVGFSLKVLLKIYKPETEGKPMAISTDVGQVLTEQKKEGGMESWIPGHQFPFPGMPDSVVVETMTVFKRIFPILYKWGWVVMRDRLPDYLKVQSQNADIGLVDPKRYSRPVRELHRVFTLMRSREGEDQIEMKGKWTEMRDMLCLFFEYDDAYRFRFMDLMNEINLKEFEFSEADRYWASKKWKYNFGFNQHDNNTTAKRNSSWRIPKKI